MKSGCEGLTLLEVVFALLLIGIGLLAVAPMFMTAMSSNEVGGTLGVVGAMALERMELLRAIEYDNLTAGGSVTTDVSGYIDTPADGYTVRWMIQDNGSPPDTRIVTVFAAAENSNMGPRKEVTLTTLRAR